MYLVCGSESEIMAQLERLELQARQIHRKIEHAPSEKDKRALNRLLLDIKQDMENLQGRLP